MGGGLCQGVEWGFLTCTSLWDWRSLLAVLNSTIATRALLVSRALSCFLPIACISDTRVWCSWCRSHFCLFMMVESAPMPTQRDLGKSTFIIAMYKGVGLFGLCTIYNSIKYFGIWDKNDIIVSFQTNSVQDGNKTKVSVSMAAEQCRNFTWMLRIPELTYRKSYCSLNGFFWWVPPPAPNRIIVQVADLCSARLSEGIISGFKAKVQLDWACIRKAHSCFWWRNLA